MLQLAEGLSVPHTSILVFCTLHSDSFLPLIYYKVLFFLAKMYMINCLLAVPLILIDHCQQLHPSYFWLGYLEYSQPVIKTTAGRPNCTLIPPLSLSCPCSQMIMSVPSSFPPSSAGMLSMARMQNSHFHGRATFTLPSVATFWSDKWEWYWKSEEIHKTSIKNIIYYSS